MRKRPQKLVLAKPTVEELQAILDGDEPDDIVWVDGQALTAVRLTELRANIGMWMDNVAAGRTLAVTRRGKVLAVLSPPRSTPRPTMRELDEILDKESDRGGLKKDETTSIQS